MCGAALVQWGSSMLACMSRVMAYISEQGRDVAAHVDGARYFEQSWRTYLRLRGLDAPRADTAPRWPPQ